jgi:hypothetical protein
MHVTARAGFVFRPIKSFKSVFFRPPDTARLTRLLAPRWIPPRFCGKMRAALDINAAQRKRSTSIGDRRYFNE